jgi:hypothetical protein
MDPAEPEPRPLPFSHAERVAALEAGERDRLKLVAHVGEVYLKNLPNPPSMESLRGDDPSFLRLQRQENPFTI